MTLPAHSFAPTRVPAAARPLRILFLVSAHNSLSRRTLVALSEQGHHVDVETTVRLTSAPFTPIGAREAVDIGLLDGAFGATAQEFATGVRTFAEQLARDPGTAARLTHKARRRARDERRAPLAAYRAEELRRSHECFFGPDRSYHEARRRFVYKLGSPCAV